MDADNSQRPPKRRKTQRDPNVISIGGKALSLSGYLAPPKPKEDKKAKSPTTVPEVPPTTTGKPDDKQTEEGLNPTRQMSSNGDKSFKKSHHAQDNGSRARQDATLLKTRKGLPIWSHQSEIQSLLRGSQTKVLVLVGETGSGKSTQVPQFLYQEPWCRRHKVPIEGVGDDVAVGGCIAITQPRRVAATTLAYRVSQEAGTPLGKGRDGLVGYSVRFDHQVPRGTRIKFLTEGMLLQELLRDPNLRQYSCIVVDEIHERSLDVDLLVGFLKQILTGDMKGRGGVPLKVVIMSATADVEGIQKFFASMAPASGEGLVKVLKIKGRQFPVSVHHEPKPVQDIQDAMVQRIFQVHTKEPLPGDILAFFTGQEEIESAQRLVEEYAATLASNVPKIKVIPLYGQLSIEAQREAFLPVKAPMTRKIVLATNIAETSVTVPGVRYVVDCGKAKIKQFRSRLGLESLLAKPISKSSAIQRAGRAGREGPGKCYRLYTEDGFKALQQDDLPEILRNDVLGAVLTMKARGIDDVLSFPLMDPPSTEAIEKALLHLHFLRAIDDNGNITPDGIKMARLPVPAPLGAVLLASADPLYDCVLEVIDIISCITSGDDIFLSVQSEEGLELVEDARKELQRREGDMMTYLTTMQQYTAENTDRTNWCKKRKINMRNMRTALSIRRQLRSLAMSNDLLPEAPPADPQPFTPVSPEKAEAIIRCFLCGFATKTAMLAPDASYVTTQGKHVVAIHPSSVMHGRKTEAIMFLEHVFTNKSYGKKVSAVQAGWIVEALER